MKYLSIAMLFLLSACSQASGKLLIAGGAVGSDNEALYKAFIENQPSGTSKVCIIPAASSSPVKSANQFKQDLIHYGLDEKRICIIPLAITDDKSTEFDERNWKDNALDKDVLAQLNSAEGFWFTGGDQMRIVELLYRDSKPTPALTILNKKLKQGAIIGGTSAGAAIMSEPMIAAGDSFSALTQPQSDKYYGMETQEKGQLYLHQGIGFFPYGLVDQHFDRKARLGRLVRALALKKIENGYAVDEDTAMLVDLSKHTLQTVGRGNVTVLNASKASIKQDPFIIKNVTLSVLSNNDIWDIKKNQLLNDVATTKGKEYYAEDANQGAGLALANGRLAQLLGYELMDNKNTQEVRRYSFLENGQGILYRFKQNDESQGYWRANGTLDQYTVTHIQMDIEPVTVTITQ